VKTEAVRAILSFVIIDASTLVLSRVHKRDALGSTRQRHHGICVHKLSVVRRTCDGHLVLLTKATC
jgi:hypothetical protein